MNLNGKFVIALLIGIAGNMVWFVQPLANVVLELTEDKIYLFVNNTYSILGALIWPFAVSLIYYKLTNDKRLGFPFWIQLGTIATSTVVVIADSIQPANSSMLFFRSIQDYIYLLGADAGVSLVVLFILAATQALALRVILGMEVRTSPVRQSYIIEGVSFDELSKELDDGFRFSMALRKGKSSTENGLLFWTHRPTTDNEVAIAVAKLNDNDTFVSFASVNTRPLYIDKSKTSPDLLKGIVKNFQGLVKSAHPSCVFRETDNVDDEANRFVLRNTNSALTRLQPIMLKLEFWILKPIRSIGIIQKAFLYLACIILVAMAVMPYLELRKWLGLSNLIEIESLFFVAIVVDLGVAVVQAQQDARR